MKKFFVVIVTFALLETAHAQFFGGFSDGLTSVPTGNQVIGPPFRIVFDDFTFDLPGDITDFSILGLDHTGSPVAMYYEIRTGMSAGNAGTLVTSGTTTGATSVPRPTDGSFGTPPPGSGQYIEYFGGFPGGSPLHVAAGTYWIGLAPLEGFGDFAVATTQGAGSIGHPINNGNAFYFDSSDPSMNYISMGANDFALRIDTLSGTNTAVPEPATFSLLALGTLGFVAWRRRYRA